MLKKYTFECFDGMEASQAVGCRWYYCHFAKDIPWHGYANLDCSDESLEAWEEDLTMYPDDDKTRNEIAWIKYFRSLGYRDTVVIHLT